MDKETKTFIEDIEKKIEKLAQTIINTMATKEALDGFRHDVNDRLNRLESSVAKKPSVKYWAQQIDELRDREETDG